MRQGRLPFSLRRGRAGLYCCLATVAMGASAVALPAYAASSPVRDTPGRAAVMGDARHAFPDAGIRFPLHTSGSSIVDAANRHVKLRMVNWYGAESPDFVVGGLKYQPISKIISEIVSMGFNGVRLPWSNQLWQTNPVVPAKVITANPQFKGEHAKTVFETVVHDLANAGLMVILDNHTSMAEWCCSDTDHNELWYVPNSATYTQTAWVNDWTSLASTFSKVPQVIGVDQRNEPRGSATWGGSTADNWQAAAQLGGDAVQKVDKNLLIFVEGTNYATDLAGVSSLPVDLTVPDHLVYEVHDYGFNTTVPSYDDWVSKIQSKWGDLVGKVPLWVGEFGTCNTSDSCVSSSSTKQLGKWFSIFTRYLRYHNLNWSYWALNGTDSDSLKGQNRYYGQTETYGVLSSKWAAPSRASLLSSLQAVQPACPGGSLKSGTYYIVNRNSGDVIDIPAYNKANGTDLDQWPRNNGSNQQWKVSSLGCGLYTITSVLDGDSIDVSGQSTKAGAAIDQWSYWGGGNQQFVIRKNSAGYYTIASINSLDPVQVPGSSKTKGTKLDQGTASSGTNQQWSFASA